MKKIKFVILLLSASAMIFSGGCNETELNSSWRTADIKIDGDVSEWGNNLTEMKNGDVFIGVMNDESNLYLAISTLNRARAMQLLMNGFTVRFRPEDGKELGINFPYGMKSESFTPGEFMNRDNRDQQNKEPELDRIINKENELLIVNEDDYPLSAYPLSNTVGIALKIKFVEGRFNYELKMPLKTLTKMPYFVDTDPGGTVEIGFQTKEREKMSREGAGMRGGGEGGMGGMGGGGGRRGGGGSVRGAGMQQLSDLDAWIEVHLAKQPG